VLNILIDGGGLPITTGVKGALKVALGYTMTAWEIVSIDGTSGSIVVELWSDSYANFPPTGPDVVGGTEKPTLSSATKAQDVSLNGGAGYPIPAGNWIMWNVASASTVKNVAVAITLTKT
jgi:hypothetical protein